MSKESWPFLFWKLKFFGSKQSFFFFNEVLLPSFTVFTAFSIMYTAVDKIQKTIEKKQEFLAEYEGTLTDMKPMFEKEPKQLNVFTELLQDEPDVDSFQIGEFISTMRRMARDTVKGGAHSLL
eukprot:TRINITY_DN3270_c0_g1_i1.p1 TRINITY_DN3270_c0_g1~~TRINITY_DN3270_c0_g1_i1.p1  ORF type:complete len:123 (-),score=21.97 TRINITY_DN3270_c0_g1_i1:926-1294(-)